MTRSRAYALILGSGPRTASICDPCQHRQEHDRTEQARATVRAHNRDRHTEETQ